MNSSVKVAKDVKIQLDRFDGTNYTRWMDKMIFLRRILVNIFQWLFAIFITRSITYFS